MDLKPLDASSCPGRSGGGRSWYWSRHPSSPSPPPPPPPSPPQSTSPPPPPPSNQANLAPPPSSLTSSPAYRKSSDFTRTEKSKIQKLWNLTENVLSQLSHFSNITFCPRARCHHPIWKFEALLSENVRQGLDGDVLQVKQIQWDVMEAGSEIQIQIQGCDTGGW